VVKVRGETRKLRWLNAAREGALHDVGTAAYAVAMTLAVYADKDGGNIFPGERKIMRATGMSQRTVRRAMAALRDAGVIVQVGKGNGMRGIAGSYRLAEPARIAGQAAFLAPDHGSSETEPRVTSGPNHGSPMASQVPIEVPIPQVRDREEGSPTTPLREVVEADRGQPEDHDPLGMVSQGEDVEPRPQTSPLRVPAGEASGVRGLIPKQPRTPHPGEWAIRTAGSLTDLDRLWRRIPEADHDRWRPLFRERWRELEMVRRP
jgi:hypothetical protein